MPQNKSTWARLFNTGLKKPRRGGLVRNLNSDVNASFCQQVDDRMLLKITENTTQRNVSEAPVKQTIIFTGVL